MIGIAHPKQVHFWKNIIHNLANDGHEVKIVAWKKDITLYLLNVYGLTYEIIGKNYKGLMRKMYGLLESDFKAFKVAKKFKPDILLAGSPALAHVSMLLRKPYIYFIDTEHAGMAYRLTYLFADVICTPSCFKKKINSKNWIMFDGYQELAYLHPNYFKPDPSVLDDLGLSKHDKFIIIRLISWGAVHDVGQQGIGAKMRAQYISKLEQYGRVFISSEGKLGNEFEEYALRIVPEKFHSLLYYAQLYIGEGGSTATEAAILGTPSVFVSSLTGTMGNFEELEERYGLVYAFQDPHVALEKALELLEDTNLKVKWQKRKEKLINEKIDVTKFITEFIENYPKRKQVIK